MIVDTALREREAAGRFANLTGLYTGESIC